MGPISASVGRGGANQPQDVRLVQELLNKHIKPPMQPLKADGLVGPKTIAAIEDFQRRVVKLSRPDGRVDPGARTFAALSAGASGTPTKPSPTPTKPPPTPTSTSTPLPTGGGGGGLTEADLQRAADALKCEVACIKAVNEVESGGSGFLPSGRPKILFEAHVFSRRTKHQYDASYPDISSPTWNRALYKGGEKEYERLEKAMALDRQAALESASWGRFQIMGFNHQSAGYGSVEAYVKDMYQSEGKQLDAFVLFLQHQNLAAPLREKRWADFAKGYNGAGYAANKYDQKLKSAYEKHSK